MSEVRQSQADQFHDSLSDNPTQAQGRHPQEYQCRDHYCRWPPGARVVSGWTKVARLNQTLSPDLHFSSGFVARGGRRRADKGQNSELNPDGCCQRADWKGFPSFKASTL
jgi:hypothetical protein